ncbi:molybdopterin cofactor-binding domain-containing protein [Desulfitobacterium sp.]|uniref:molybdopterin cofactor-binding domain-containing protein n=1 Tax=Desulfitobacterium sp. TaxID=49981 RepID=UPI002C458DAF|nr:molybdopterin cofactor-binding domain-containing protein [Desulfitobacterium sp.]HVJ49183.1 molybdopterin cofactor-binding domain-containing protein [Desulfitobacterium sp.]
MPECSVYYQPQSMADALTLLANSEGRLKPLAGGTDILPAMKKGELRDVGLIDLSKIPDIRKVSIQGNVIKLGSLCTFSQIENSPLIKDEVPLLAEAAGTVGSPQIRSIGTIGGNIANASPAADTVNAMVALDAKAKLDSAEGSRTVLVSELLCGVGKTNIQPEDAADLDLQGALTLKVLRSTVAHAKVKGFDVTEAMKVPGVVRVFTYEDIPGINGYGIIVKDQPALTDKVRFKGDALALVAAEDEVSAKKALELIKVDLEELPPVYDVWSAMKEDAPAIHDKGNIQLISKIKKGDVESALRQAEVVISRRYTTQKIEHCAIETEAGVAFMDEDVLVIKVCTQNPHYDRNDVARVLGLPMNKVRIIQMATGGGFGGKLDISVQCFLGLAALKLGRPVKMNYDRQESFIATGKRHPFFIDYTTASDKEGKLLAVKVKVVGDTGAYASYGPATLIRAGVHATGPYEVPNVDIEVLCVYTNNPFSGAMRGFGTPQMAFASESQMDIVAQALKISPLEIRRRNIVHEGSITATGQKLEGSIGIGKTLEAAWEKALQVMPELEARYK